MDIYPIYKIFIHCHGNKEYRLNTSTNIFLKHIKNTNINGYAGFRRSLFQINKREIFACGINQLGQCGLGHVNDPQITSSLIPAAPPNIASQEGC